MAGADTPRRVTIFLAFAQDRIDATRYLRNLPLEQSRIRAALEPAVAAGLCGIVERSNVTPDAVFDVFQKNASGCIAVFHFGGHAGSGALLLETPYGARATVHAAGLAQFLGERRGLALVFLNGCSSQDQVDGLLQAGVAAVIATSTSIRDDVASDFAARFYGALGHGATLRSAFVQAEAIVRSQRGERSGAALHDADPDAPADDGRWPWRLYTASGTGDSAERWNLPEAAYDPLYGLPPVPDGELPAKPFKHLHWFERADAAVFFGRGQDIRRLYSALTDPSAAPIVLFFGATGVGKSSLLDAGLRPRLEATHTVRYQRHRRESGLAGTFHHALGASDAESPAQAWQREEAKGRPLVVILDQIEEAWMHAGTPADAAAFLAQLRDLFHAGATRPRGRLMLSFRKEWLADVLRLLDAKGLPRTLHELGALNRAGVVEAITGPSLQPRLHDHYHLDVEPGLAERIADDLLADPQAAMAPTLQILLSKLWDRAFAADPAAPSLRSADYCELQRAGLLLDDFVSEELEVLRAADARAVDSGLVLDLLNYHTTPFASTASRSGADLRARYGDRPELDAIVERCTRGHLLMRSTLPAAEHGDGDGGVMRTATRLAHDTLAPLIRNRHEQSLRPGQRAARILEQRAREWQDGSSGAVLDDFDLAQVEAGAAGMRAWSAAEQRLVASSRQERQRRRRMRRIFSAAGVAALLLIVITGIVAWRLALDARASEKRLRDRTTAAIAWSTRDPTDRLLALLEIDHIDATPTAQSQLFDAIRHRVSRVSIVGAQTARLNRSGDRVLTTAGNVAQIWDINGETLLQTFTGHTKPLNSAVFNTAGDRVLTASDDGTVGLWDVANGALPLLMFRGIEGRWVRSAIFNVAGDRVLTASNDGTVRLWDAKNGETLLRTFEGHEGVVNSAVFDTSGSRILTASKDGTARLWDVNRSDRPQVTFKGHRQAVNFAVFNAEGNRVLTASDDGTAQLWSIDNGDKPMRTFSGHQGGVNSAVFNAVGDRVLTASSDRTVRLWHVDDDEPPQVFAEHEESVTFAVFSAQGDRVLTTSGYGTVQLFDVEGGDAPLKSFSGRSHRTSSVAFSTAGDRVLTLVYSGAKLWDVDNDSTPLRTFSHDKIVSSAVFNVAGDRVLTASEDGTARLWDTDNDRAPLRTYQANAAINSAVFNTAGDHILAASDRGAQLWGIGADERSLKVFSPDRKAYSAVFNAAGNRVLVTSDDGMARLWDIENSSLPLQTFVPHDGSYPRAISALFNTAGNRILTASGGVAQLWDISNGRTPLRAFVGHRNWVRSAVLNSAGDRVLTASDDGTARLWDANNGQMPLQTFSGQHGPATAAAFDPSGDYVLIASADEQVRLWPASGEALKAVARSRTRTCLDAYLIENALGETKARAEARQRACTACVPQYFEVFESFPPGDTRRYLQAWKRYQQCYRERIG